LAAWTLKSPDGGSQHLDDFCTFFHLICLFQIVSPHVRVEANGASTTKKEISKMRKKILVLTAMAISVIGVAEARPFFLTVMGSGVVQDGDRDSAASQASDQAVQSANANCAGTVVRSIKSPPICFGGGDDPDTCTVIVTATCQIGN
jgi:hypothetical protein